MDRFMITVAQIVCVICMLIPAAVLVIGKVSKRISEIKPFFAGLGICLTIALILGIVFLNTEYSELILFLLPLTILCSSYFLYRNKFYAPLQAVPYCLGTSQAACFLCSVLLLISLAEMSDGHGEHCDCYYERRGELGSAGQYVVTAIIRAVITCFMTLAVKKINSSEKLSDFKKAVLSALVSTALCVPVELFVI